MTGLKRECHDGELKGLGLAYCTGVGLSMICPQPDPFHVEEGMPVEEEANYISIGYLHMRCHVGPRGGISTCARHPGQRVEANEEDTDTGRALGGGHMDPRETAILAEALPLHRHTAPRERAKLDLPQCIASAQSRASTFG